MLINDINPKPYQELHLSIPVIQSKLSFDPEDVFTSTGKVCTLQLYIDCTIPSLYLNVSFEALNVLEGCVQLCLTVLFL